MFPFPEFRRTNLDLSPRGQPITGRSRIHHNPAGRLVSCCLLNLFCTQAKAENQQKGHVDNRKTNAHKFQM